MQLYIEGRIRTNKWQDKEGNNKYSTEIIATENCPKTIFA
jgi:single-strand DNA-binding protein